tara:strand:- start:14196 stop:14939 length:744 start_codon:yes stop_codon:yes gene_type:complete
MKKDNNIRPVGLKGNNQINRMRSLMNMTPIHENAKTSVVELTKMGPDGKVYGIVRENHKYFIKITNKKQNLIAEDFMYVGGLQNKTEKAFDSYSQATKQLNLKFLSLNEALNKTEIINVLKNDNLLAESFESYNENPKPSQPDTLLGTVKGEGKNDGHDKEIIGDEGEDGNPDVDTPPVVEEGDEITEEEGDEITEEDAVELTESEKAIDNIIRELRGEALTETQKLSINTAIHKIQEGENSSKKKV